MQGMDIVEQPFGIRKCHTVLGKIARCFVVILLEFKHCDLLEFSSICQMGANVKPWHGVLAARRTRRKTR